MSKIHQGSTSGSLMGSLLNEISKIRQSVASTLTPEMATAVASLESHHTGAVATSIGNAAGNIKSRFGSSLNEISVALCGGKEGAEANALHASLSAHNAGLEAMSIITLGSGGMQTNMKSSYLGQLKRSEEAGSTSALDQSALNRFPYQPSLGIESFNSVDVDKHVDMSATYNFAATQQDEFSALFYPIIIGTPDLVYWTLIAKRPAVTYGATHDADGTVTKYDKINLLDSFRDHTVLENEDTRVVPYLNPNNSQNAYFLTALPTTFKVRNQDIPTAPLKFGAELEDGIDLKGLSSHPDLVKAGLLTQVDKLDTGSRLSKLYIEVSDGTDTALVPVSTERMLHSQFNAVREGQTEWSQLTFHARDFVLDTRSATDVANAPIVALNGAKTAGLSLVLNLRVTGELHLETGELRATAFPVKLVKVVDESGVESASSTALTGVTFKLVGMDLNARWTNAGRRTVGLLLDHDSITRNYYVPTLAPIGLQRAVSEDTVSADVEDLVTATHARMCNMAVTSLLAHEEQVKFMFNESIRKNTRGRTPDWQGRETFNGVGSLYLAPFYDEANVDLLALVNSITSSDKMADVRGFFAGLINEIAYRMVTESGYLPALRTYTGDMKAKPKLLIGTDVYLPAFMFIPGDDRFAGMEMDYDVASSYDNRMAGKIYLSLAGVNRANTMNILGHGNMLYIPELIGTIPMPRGGNIVNETLVQPRFRFVEHIPVLAVINVSNVKAVMQNRVSLNINDVTP